MSCVLLTIHISPHQAVRALHTRTDAHAARMNQCFVLFVGSVHSMCNDAQSRLVDIIYGSQTEQAGCDECPSRIRMEQVWMSLKDIQLVFPFFFLYYAYSIILNDRLCRIYLFSSAALFTVNSKMFNEFSILTRLIK